jgi:glycogen synthase
MQILTVFQEMRLPELGIAYPANTSGGYGEMARGIPQALDQAGIQHLSFVPLYRMGDNGYCFDYDSDFVPGAKFWKDIIYHVYYQPKVVSVYQVEMKNGTRVFGLKFEAADKLYKDEFAKKTLAAHLGRIVPAVLKEMQIVPQIAWTHEWAPGLVLVNMASDPFFSGTKLLNTIHSPQGAALNCYDTGEFDSLAIPPEYRPAFTENGNLDPTLGVVSVAHLTNGVSIEHGEVCQRRFWQYQNKIIGIRNGVARRGVLSAGLRALPENPTADQLASAHLNDKAAFLRDLAECTGRTLDFNLPLICRFCRVATYKNVGPMFEPILYHLCVERQANIVVGGVAHQKDGDARYWEGKYTNWMNDPQFQGRFVYIGRPHYNDEWRMNAIRGCDIWIECPFPGTEACGTSGMMAEICGKPVVGTRTGWHKECGIPYNPQTETGHSFWIDPYTPEMMAKQLDWLINIFYQHRDQKNASWPELKRRVFLAGQEHDISHMIERYRSQAFEPLLNAQSASTAA